MSKQKRNNSFPPKKVQPQNNPKNPQVLTKTAVYSGPIPDPSTLAGYENIHEGAAGRILTMAENEANHRHSIEKRHLGGVINNERIGMCCGLFVCLVALCGGFYCVLNGLLLQVL